jgi:hypothetical protein
MDQILSAVRIRKEDVIPAKTPCMKRSLMVAWTAFENEVTKTERRVFDRLATPTQLQAFLDRLTYSSDPIYRSPLRVLRERKGHCFDGAIFAAAGLWRIGRPPLILELLPNHRDDDHLLAVYRQDGYWGALGHSNFGGLRYREPIFRTLRELVMSYFEQFYNTAREKTLRGYTLPLNLNAFDSRRWMTRDGTMREIAGGLDRVPRRRLLTRAMVRRLAPVDERSFRSGLIGAVPKGLYKPRG